MEIGRLNKRIMLQRRTGALDGSGQLANSWVDVATVWADIRPITGREKMRALMVGWELTHTVLIRYNVTFPPVQTLATWRVKYGDRILSISSALDFDEAHAVIVLDCIEGGPDGN